jgi:predicted metalloendopeptidase
MNAPCIAAFLCLASAAVAEVDPSNFDTAVRPQDDFYQYANGGWMKKTLSRPTRAGGARAAF